MGTRDLSAKAPAFFWGQRSHGRQWIYKGLRGILAIPQQQSWCPHILSVTLRGRARQIAGPLHSPLAPQAEEGVSRPDDAGTIRSPGWSPLSLSRLPLVAAVTRGPRSTPASVSLVSGLVMWGTLSLCALISTKVIILPVAGSDELLCVSTKHRAWHMVREATWETERDKTKLAP